MGGLAVRVGTALVLLPLVLSLVWVPSLRVGWVVFVAVAVGVGMREYGAILRAKGIGFDAVPAVVGVMAVVLGAYLGGALGASAVFFAVGLLLAFGQVARHDPSIAGISSSVFGALYLGWFPSHVILLHQEPGVGPGLLTILVGCVALTDIGAYFIGKRFGRRKLAPVVSPNKSWEGAIGGFLCAVLAMGGAFYLKEKHFPELLPDWCVWAYLGMGAALSVSGQVGDLVESALKRDAGIKDAGSIFPGHGGVLDRFDGFLFAAPVLYYGAKFF